MACSTATATTWAAPAVLGKAGASSPQSDSAARYYPFCDWRAEPTQTITSLGYTGHRHNNQGCGAWP